MLLAQRECAAVLSVRTKLSLIHVMQRTHTYTYEGDHTVSTIRVLHFIERGRNNVMFNEFLQGTHGQ